MEGVEAENAFSLWMVEKSLLAAFVDVCGVLFTAQFIVRGEPENIVSLLMQVGIWMELWAVPCVLEVLSCDVNGNQ